MVELRLDSVLRDHELTSAHYCTTGFSALLIAFGLNEMCHFPWLASSLFEDQNGSIRLIKTCLMYSELCTNAVIKSSLELF